MIAHEYGNHVQNLTGVREQARDGDTGPQSKAVRVELQADCYAGAWVANATRTGLIEEITRADNRSEKCVTRKTPLTLDC